MRHDRTLYVQILALFATVLLAACSTERKNTSGDNPGKGLQDGGGSGRDTGMPSMFSGDAAGPMTCGAGSTAPGCPCTAGAGTVACWDGPPADRNVGLCKDGTQTCTVTGQGEFMQGTWGPCTGEVLECGDAGSDAGMQDSAPIMVMTEDAGIDSGPIMIGTADAGGVDTGIPIMVVDAGCATGCCASQNIAFVNCIPAGASPLTVKPGAYSIQTIACSAVQSPSALAAFDTIVYVGPVAPPGAADFPPAVSTQLAAGAKVIFFSTGTCDGTPGGTCNFGTNNWQTIYGLLYLEDNMEFHESIAQATITTPNTDSMNTAFSQATYGSFQLNHLMFDGTVANTYLDYPTGANLSGTFSWCSDLVGASADGTRSTPFHGYLLDSLPTRKGLLIASTLDYVLAGNTFDFTEPFLASHLTQKWDQQGNSMACGLMCGANGQVPWVPVTGMGKPVIYLYPPKEEDVYVRLDLDGKLVTTYPQYDEGVHGWKVHAKPDGSLKDLHDGREYSYLYWSGESAKFKPSFEEGFVVSGKDTRTFLQDKLAHLGLIPKEYNDMIVYWLPYMENHPYNLISFAHESYTNVAKLSVEPKPDSMLRVFMVFKKLDHPISVKPQKIEPFQRKGFAVVEWGGSEIGGDWSVIH